MASIYDLYIEQGSNFTQVLDLSGDFTTAVLSSTLKDSDGEIIIDFAEWADATNGIMNINLSALETSGMSQGVGYYNIETIISGVTDRILQGRIYVDGEVK